MTNSSFEYSQLLILKKQTLDKINEVEEEILDLESKYMWRWNSYHIQAEKEARISELLDYKSRLLSSLKVIRKKIKNMKILLEYSNIYET